MTDHTDVPVVATGDWIDAAWINQYIGDNVRAWRQGFVTGGDMPYALDANTITALNKPSVASLMTMDNTGVPAWLAKTGLPGLVHTVGNVFDGSSHGTITTASFVSIGSGVKFDLTLAKVCTVIAWATGMGYVDNGTDEGFFALSINGTIDPNTVIRIIQTAKTPFSCMYKASAVPVGTRTVELKFKASNAGDPIRVDGVVVHAIAIVE